MWQRLRTISLSFFSSIIQKCHFLPILFVYPSYSNCPSHCKKFCPFMSPYLIYTVMILFISFCSSCLMTVASSFFFSTIVSCLLLLSQSSLCHINNSIDRDNNESLLSHSFSFVFFFFCLSTPFSFFFHSSNGRIDEQ